MFLTTRLYHETVYSSTGPRNNSADLLCHDSSLQGIWGSVYSGPSSKLSMPSPDLSPVVQRNLASGALSSSLPSQVPHFHHTAYIPVPLPFPFLLSQPHIYLFLWLLFWVVRTSLVEFFNSHHVGNQTLDYTYGYLGSSASPTSYWPHHPRPLLLSHLESEDSTNSASIITRTK